MAIYHLHLKNISRGDGRSAVACAAYRAGETLPNEAEERQSKFGGRRDVRFTGIVLPAGAPTWMSERGRLWNAVEAAERRRDARLAKEIEVALPRELSPSQQVELVLAMATGLASGGLVVDYAIHDDGLNTNPHAHMMLTTRAVSAAGFAGKLRGADDKVFLQQTRALWGKLTNLSLGKAGVSASVDHRSHAARGLAERPGDHRGVDPDERRLKRDARDRAGGRMDTQTEPTRQAMAADHACRGQFPLLAVRADWPPATRMPPRDMDASAREEHQRFWREVDRRHYSQEPERDRQPADATSEALDQVEGLRGRLEQLAASRAVPDEMSGLRADLEALRATIVQIRLEEIERGDREYQHERDLPLPGPDRMPVSRTELDEAQDRMVADMGRRDEPQPLNRYLKDLDARPAERGGAQRAFDEFEREHERDEPSRY